MNTTDIKSITIGGKTVSKMEIWVSSTVKKEVKFAEYSVKFYDNINAGSNDGNNGYYYMDNQTMETISDLPSQRTISPGDQLGSLPGISNKTYGLTYNGVYQSYLIAVHNWYYNPECTQLASSTDYPTGDVKLYAKWTKTDSTKIHGTTSGKSIKVPKFVTKISQAYVIGGGGPSGSTSTCDAGTGEICEVAICGSGGWGGTVSSASLNAPVNPGDIITLYNGVGGTAGNNGGQSYINVNNSRLSYGGLTFTGNGGGQGTSSTRRFNLSDTDPESHICHGKIRPCVGWEMYNYGYTKEVSGYSIVGNMKFVFRATKNQWGTYTPIYIDFYSNWGSWQWWQQRVNIGRYYVTNDDDDDVCSVSSYASCNDWAREGVQTDSSGNPRYGCPGFGGFAISTGSDRKLDIQPGIAGDSYVVLAS